MTGDLQGQKIENGSRVGVLLENHAYSPYFGSTSSAAVNGKKSWARSIVTII